MSHDVDDAIDRLDAIGLDELNELAELQTRRDRKYLVTEHDLAVIIGTSPVGTRALEKTSGRWSLYQSTYYDTGRLDSFHLAARKRPARFKVRTRCYVDSGLTLVELKAKDRRGHTTKRRSTLSAVDAPTADVRAFARQERASRRFADELRPTLTNRYARATLVLPDGAARITIDADFEAIAATGARTALPGLFIVETKTAGKPSAIDRQLWARGHRPVRFSKYSTAMAAMHPDLPGNRWNRTACRLHPGGPRLRADPAAVLPPSRSLHLQGTIR